VTFNVARFGTAGELHTACGPYLAEREVEHNLLLGLLSELSRPETVYQPPYYLAAVRDDAGRIHGCALRTPPFKLLLTELPAAALASLCADAAAFAPLPTAVSSDEPTASAFAEAWCARQGGSWRVGFRQRLYRLDAVVPPPQPAAGAARVAGAHDVPLVAGWLEAFGRDAGMLVGDARARARALVAAGDVVLWIDDGDAVSMAAVTGRTTHGARVGYVYTPDARRGHGYASVCVAELSARLLASGRRFCCLFTDLANPVSNTIYRRLGYQPVCDFVDCVLDAG
jgi:hypothetical protein